VAKESPHVERISRSAILARIEAGGRTARIFVKQATSGTLALPRDVGVLETRGLEHRHDIVAAANDDLAERAKPRLVTPRCGNRSDADRGAECLVGGFKPSGNIYRVAMSRVVKLGADSNIADDGGSGLEANARAPKPDPRGDGGRPLTMSAVQLRIRRPSEDGP